MEGVQVISREIVKPSSEIHPRQLKLSYLDQLSGHVYFPIIFFFQDPESTTTSNHVKISQKLKHTLSDTLTSFYPLAGRVKSEDSVVVDCNDTGVEFVIARNHAQQMMDFLKDPDVEGKLKQYITMDPAKYCPHDRPLFFVQITFFSCGGIALGMCFSHRISDLQSSVAFINCWAHACKTGEPAAAAENSRFNLADYFPAREFSGPDWTMPNNKYYRTKRLVFDKEKIAALKQYVISSPVSTVKDPSRVEVISAFMWKLLLDNSINTFGAVFHTVNLRRRKSPSYLLENVHGNCLMLASAFADEGVQDQFHHLVAKIRRSIRRLDDDYITEAQTGDNYVKDLFDVFSKGNAVEGCFFSSWCGFPLYDVDYGFGTPIWLGVTALQVNNSVVLLSSKTGENIEAWVNMEQLNFEMLRNQINLISGLLPLPTI